MIVNQVIELIAVGVVLAYAGSAAPKGYLICDKSGISRSIYKKLFNVIENIFGNCESEVFNITKLQQKFILDKLTSSKITEEVSRTGGTIDHTISHTHTVIIPSEDATVLLNIEQVRCDDKHLVSNLNSEFNNSPSISLNFMVYKNLK